MLPVIVPLKGKRAEPRVAVFDYGGGTGRDPSACVSPAQQTKLQVDFKAQLAELQAKCKWLGTLLPPGVASGPYQRQTDFHVSVSAVYNKSKALVPAWLGQRGSIELPAHRVVAGEASIAHELAHVLFPNGNRMLAEGLAVYLQHKLVPHAAVYPNFGDHLEALVADCIFTTYPKRTTYALWNMDLDGLERISTPDELSLRIGTDPIIGAEQGDLDPPPEQVKFVYAVAGSFVGFLLDNPLGDPLLTQSKFGALYQSTPLRPLERDSGPADRWQDFYKGKGKSYSFADLGLMWKTYMHFLLCSKQALKFAGLPAKKEIAIPQKYRNRALVKAALAKLEKLVPPP
jgi:hypothetical protein